MMAKDKGVLGTATVGPKGQIVIPQAARTALGIEEGDMLLVIRSHEKSLMLIDTTEIGVPLEAFEKKLGVRLSRAKA